MSLFTLRRQSERTKSVRRIDISMSAALPNLGVPTPAELRATVEEWIDGYIERGSIDDGGGHVLDGWLRTCETDAQTALQELIDQQRQVDDTLVDRAKKAADRAQVRFERIQERAQRYSDTASECRARALGAVAKASADPMAELLRDTAL